MIEACGLTKWYGSTLAVDDLSFTVRPGIVTGFLGPNGAGKTTSIRLILGLDTPTAGKVTIGGRPHRRAESPMREIGALLGDPAVLMFDEPVNGLDPEGIMWIRTLMRSLAAEGRVVFVSSHLMSEMEHTADHLIVIGRGRPGRRGRHHLKEHRLTRQRRELGGPWPGRRPGGRHRVRPRHPDSPPRRGQDLAGAGIHGTHRGQRGLPRG
jgi:ABC-type multidrug transport system ATPase subunit